MRHHRSYLVLAGIVLSSAFAAGGQMYDSYIWQFPAVTGISSDANAMKATLQAEAQKILDAGHLAPLRCAFADQSNEGYFLYHERGRILATLAWAYPYLTADQQTSARAYVAGELSNPAYAPWNTSPKNLDPAVGAHRELYTTSQVWNWGDFWGAKAGQNRPVVQNLYGLWLWAYRANDWGVVSNNWSSIKSYYNAYKGEGNIYGTMCAHIAMARMAQQQNDAAARDAAIANANTAFNDGKTFATIDTRCRATYYPRFYNNPMIYSGAMFLNLSPEVGRYLKDYVSTAVLARADQGKALWPEWWILQARYGVNSWTGNEGVGLTPEAQGMFFPVEKWVRGAPASTLAGYMVSSPDGRGDCYWLENLVQAIEAYGTLAWTDVRDGEQGVADLMEASPPAPASQAVAPKGAASPTSPKAKQEKRIRPPAS